MLYPPMSELLTHINSRYLLVNVVAHRARQISIEAEEYQKLQGAGDMGLRLAALKGGAEFDRKGRCFGSCVCH